MKSKLDYEPFKTQCKECQNYLIPRKFWCSICEEYTDIKEDEEYAADC